MKRIKESEGIDMAQWSEGYVTEIEYIADCFPDLSPTHLNLALLHRGIAAPDTSGAFNYLELGFGQGITLTLLAAMRPQAQFFGNDFNPAHVLAARALADRAQLDNLHLFEDSFEELLTRDLPEMDYIVLHGIYSWISAENRAHIVSLIRKRLKTGGVVYVSYNAQPGWAPKAPMQRAMAEFVSRHGGESLTERYRAAREFLAALDESGAGYFVHNPVAQEQLAGLWSFNDAYLVHEFASQNWVALHHADVVSDMNGAKLGFAGSTTLANNFPLYSIPPKAATLYQSAQDPVMRELIRDFSVNTQFRRDIFVRGERRLSESELDAGYRSLKVGLRRLVSECDPDARLPVGDVALDPAACQPILQALAEGSKTVEVLAALPAFAKLGPSACVDTINLLLCLKYISPVLAEATEADGDQLARRAEAINLALMERAFSGRYVAALASPVIGGGIDIDRADVLFLAARQAGSDDLPRFAWAALERAGARLTCDGIPLEGEAAHLEELRRRETVFREARLEHYRALGVV
jgi:SAM-dependent methyltransferase